MINPHAAHPLLVEDTDLARAWGRVLVHVIDNPGTAISPLVLSVTGFSNGKMPEGETPEGETPEDPNIRAALDAALASLGMQSVHTVANTIFPQSLWRLAGYDRQGLYAEYLANRSRYRALAPTKNGRGLYFERLIAYGEEGAPEGQLVNQLEFILTQYNARKGVRASMLQASTFDPTHDHTPAAQLGFPCLQHVSFVPVGDGTLAVNAFYATQQLFDKAYGNYLGLCRLGHFMAHEMGLSLGRLNCFVGVEKLERVTKSARAIDLVVGMVRRALETSSHGGSEPQFVSQHVRQDTGGRDDRGGSSGRANRADSLARVTQGNG